MRGVNYPDPASGNLESCLVGRSLAKDKETEKHSRFRV